EELRKYDPQTFPDIVPVLIDVLGSDAKPSVRTEAAQTLGKLRPISQAVGQALEQAVAKDSSMRVRRQAPSSLPPYHRTPYRRPAPRDRRCGRPPPCRPPARPPPRGDRRAPARGNRARGPPPPHPPPRAGGSPPPHPTLPRL